MRLVRNMLMEDIRKCAEIFTEAYRTLYSEPWTVETAEKRISEVFNQDKDFCFVLEIEDSVCGFLAARRFSWYDGVRIWIEEIVVEENCRGQGCGTLLLKSLKETCKEQGVVGYSLISEKKSKAYIYYINRGFSPSPWVRMKVDEEFFKMDNNA